MHELRIGKLNSTLLSEIIKDGDEQRVNRLLGNFSQLYHFKFAGQYFSGQSMIHITCYYYKTLTWMLPRPLKSFAIVLLLCQEFSLLFDTLEFEPTHLLRWYRIINWAIVLEVFLVYYSERIVNLAWAIFKYLISILTHGDWVKWLIFFENFTMRFSAAFTKLDPHNMPYWKY